MSEGHTKRRDAASAGLNAGASALASSEAVARRRPDRLPSTCPHCEYDRRFPGFEAGGWMRQDNNGPIVSCPMCNPDGTYKAEGRS